MQEGYGVVPCPDGGAHWHVIRSRVDGSDVRWLVGPGGHPVTFDTRGDAELVCQALSGQLSLRKDDGSFKVDTSTAELIGDPYVN